LPPERRDHADQRCERRSPARGAAQVIVRLSPAIERELAAAGGSSDLCLPRLAPRESEVVCKFASGSSITEIARAGRNANTAA